MAVIYSGQTLAPSEVVFLTADQFLAKAALSQPHAISFQPSLYPLPGSDMGVAKQPLAELAWMAAFLALQAAAVIRLEIRATKALLGLRTTQSLLAYPGAETASWPEGSLENGIQLMVRAQPAAGQNEVGHLIDRVFASDNYDPFGWVCDCVRDGLARRGLVTGGDYHPTPPALAAAAAQFGETKGLLVECQHGHSDLWDVLHTRVYQAMKRHDASDSNS